MNEGQSLGSSYQYSAASIARLGGFVELVLKWNPSINLVSRSSSKVIWDRHIVDSARLLDVPDLHAHLWVDMGSGGGFPGLVVAILAEERFPDMSVVLIEADQRKATFLSQAIHMLGAKARVITSRIEKVDPILCDIVSARALAPLDGLLELSGRHLKREGRGLFLKGRTVHDEITNAKLTWDFDLKLIPAKRPDQGPIVDVSNMAHR